MIRSAKLALIAILVFEISSASSFVPSPTFGMQPSITNVNGMNRDQPSGERKETGSVRSLNTTLKRRSSSLGEESDSSSLRRSSRLRLRAASQQTVLQKNDSPPKFTFGVIADIQYAPIPDGYSYAGVPRYYRHSLDAARHAAEHFQRERLPLVLNLGDTIDGKCQDVEKHGGKHENKHVDAGHAAIDDVVDALSVYQHGPILHTYGNHELYNLDRQELGKKLKIPFVKEPCGDLVGYRSYVHESVRFVVLDSYDLGLMQRCPQSSRKYKLAANLLAKHNPNFPELENSPEGMNGVKKRYVAFNGGIDEPQLEWLRDTLQEARHARQKVIILCHQPILPGSSNPVCLVWNYNDVLKILREYSDVVAVSLSGHAHKGGYKRDKSGIHFRVIEAVLESPDPIKTYGMVDVHDDRVIIRGFGECTSAVYDLDHHSHVIEHAESLNGTTACATIA